MNFKTQFYQLGYDFLAELLKSIDEAQMPLKKNWDIDHICYRTASAESYHQVCSELAKFAELLTESDVNGRPIATFKLQEPFKVEGHIIDLVEVPAPKGSVSFADGFEHVEIVVDIALTELKSELQEAGISYTESPKPFNTEIKVSIPRGNLKFHQLSLESVIRLEQSRAYPALRTSKVLEALADFEPLVAGTFPLGLANDRSDLDIVVTMADKVKLESVVRTTFGSQPQFTIEQVPSNRFFCRFVYDLIPIEIYGEETSSAKQAAYHHFLIEERLLKLGGPNLIKNINELRQQGLKTEPAFAAALGLSGDPFETLLVLQTLGLAELSATVDL
jgi:predicted metalloenzyme YecM